MSAVEVAGAGVSRRMGAATMTAYAGAVAFLVAAAWYALVVEEVVVAAEPGPQAGQSREDWLRTYFSWLASTFPHERVYGGAAIVGFLCLLATASFARDRLLGGRALATLAARAVTLGATIWVVGDVVSLGGHHAIGVMTNRGDALETVRLLAWLIDDINDAFELVGLAAISAGFLALAWPRIKPPARQAAWRRFTGLVGLVQFATAAAYAAGAYDVVDLLLVVGGVVLLPLWLVWTGRLLHDGRVEPRTSGGVP